MRVSVATLKGTHPLDFAREADKLGVLGHYYTALPKSRVAAIARDRVKSCPILLLPAFVLRGAGLGRVERHFDWTITEAFDRWLRGAVGECDVFQVGSSYGLRALRRAKAEYGAFTVCDHGSSHIRQQDEVLLAEAVRSGIRGRRVDPRMINKEEAEYDTVDLILVPSTYARHSFLQRGVDPNKVVAIPYGVRLEYFYPTERRDSVFRVLCVATLTLSKGIGYLLDATTRLSLPHSEVVLRGAALPESKKLLAPYEGRFRLHPPVSRHTHELRDLYSQASVLVLPSVDDGFGLVMSEAMACGVPVIATTNTGGPDLITDGKDGFVVPARSADAIAERLQYLYEHPEERAAMGRAALQKVRALSSWRQYAGQLVDVYRERLSHPRAT